jgi:hypothetical protein
MIPKNEPVVEKTNASKLAELRAKASSPEAMKAYKTAALVVAAPVGLGIAYAVTLKVAGITYAALS